MTANQLRKLQQENIDKKLMAAELEARRREESEKKEFAKFTENLPSYFETEILPELLKAANQTHYVDRKIRHEMSMHFTDKRAAMLVEYLQKLGYTVKTDSVYHEAYSGRGEGPDCPAHWSVNFNISW